MMSYDMVIFVLDLLLLTALLYTVNFLNRRSCWYIKASYFLMSVGVLCHLLHFLPSMALICSTDTLHTLYDTLTPTGMLLILLLDRRAAPRTGSEPRFIPDTRLQ